MPTTSRPIRYKAYGLDMDVMIQDNLPAGGSVPERLLVAMHKATGMLRAAVVRAIAGTGIRTRTGALVGGLEENVHQDARVTIGRLSVGKRQRHVARFLESGTAAHEIVPRGATKAQRAAFYRSRRNRNRPKAKLAHALAFQGAGGQQFARRIQHPGIRARHFLRLAGTTATPSIIAAFEDAFRVDAQPTSAAVTATTRPVYGVPL